MILLLPFIVDHYLFPRIAENIPFDKKYFSISRISPSTLRGTFAFEDNTKSGVRVPKFELRYSIPDLLDKKISLLRIDSAIIHLEEEGGKLKVRGMQEKLNNEQKSEFVLPALPVKLEKIIIEESLIVLHRDGSSPVNLRVDGSIQLQYQGDDEGGNLLAGAEGEINTAGAITTRTRFYGKKLSENPGISIETDVPFLHELVKLAPDPVNVDLQGSAFITANVEMDNLNQLGGYSATLNVSDVQLGSGNVLVTDAADDTPIVVNIIGSPDKIEVTTENLVVAKPEVSPVAISCKYQPKAKLFSADMRVLPERTNAAVNIKVEGNHNDGAVAATFTMNGEPFTLGESLFVSEQMVEGEISYGEKQLAAKLRGAIAQVKDANSQSSLHNISLLLPYNSALLAPGLSIPGTLAIEEIRYKERNSGSLQVAVELFDDRVELNSLLTSPISDEFAKRCSAIATVQRDVQINCVVPELDVNDGMLEGIVKLPEGLTFTGKIAAESRIQMREGRLTGDAAVRYDDGVISFNEYAVSGVAAQVNFPDFPHLRSGPNQLATIQSIDLGKIEMSDARIKFRVDDAETIFIEGVKLNWCGGRVETGGLRLYKDMENVDTTLYCDRLGYTELLNQLGIGNAEGEGSLNGRLPIFISKDGVRFDDGFLFSTPGNSGIVRFSNTDQLRQGMGAVSQTTYLDYSLSALENFAYNWTKLTFNTQEEELLLTLQLDGKPAEPLPYGYKQGQIVKTDKGSGLQHPIRLDVNFRLPLNELFRYGKNIQSLMENM